MKYRLNVQKFKKFLFSVFAMLLCSGVFSAMLLLLITAPAEARF